MSEPLHVAFVWHMHQPWYRSPVTGAFDMPWVRMHALKDYADMVTTLSSYPSLHQTFNLVPSLVEQLEVYVSGDFVDVYWEHTLKPAAELDEAERAFVVERMCERSAHLRASSNPRYLELACKREGLAALGWRAAAREFSADELRDLQVWFNLAWFDPNTLESEPLAGLVARGRNFQEEDKLAIAQVQAEILAQTLPVYKDAATRAQVELISSPYFHPILPLLANTDSARVSAPDTVLPPSRFAHPEDAREQIRSALDKHAHVFGEPPRGMWCSEQAVGEDVLPLLIEAGLEWTISDETVLWRSLSGAARSYAVVSPGTVRTGPAVGGTVAASAGDEDTPYVPYRLEREGGAVDIVFRDHTLSDLIGFGYQSWDSKDAAADLLQRLREIGSRPAEAPRLVTIALDGENAWEYYPRDGRDFLCYLYEGLAADESLRCVTVSEHLRTSPPTRSLRWLHTGSWIGGDLRTWSGDRAHNRAWQLLHEARDLAARTLSSGRQTTVGGPEMTAAVWRHVLVAEGSDWLWWFGDHHHTELDYVWDLNFRQHLQAVYRALGRPVPVELLYPLLGPSPAARSAGPTGPISPSIDGVAGPDEWLAAGYLSPEMPSTMQLADSTRIEEVRYGWNGPSLCVLLVPRDRSALPGLQVEMHLAGAGPVDVPVATLALAQDGKVEVTCSEDCVFTGPVEAAWADVLEVSLPLGTLESWTSGGVELVVRVGRGELIEHVFRSGRVASA